MNRPKFITFAVIFVTVLGAGLYFRTYDLQMYLFKTQQEIAEDAQERVYAFMHRQLRPQLKEKFPGISGEEMERRLKEATDDLKERDHDQYYDRLHRTFAGSPKNEGISGHYLLGADSYHYYDLTNRIHRLGNLSDQFKNGRFFHPGRHAPFGLWAPVSLHPYLGFICHKILSLFSSKINLMISAASLPLFLFFILLLSFMFLVWVLDSPPIGVIAGTFAVAFSPLLIQRTFFGWYDTDPYAIIFPYILFAIFFWASNQEKKKTVYWGAGIAGFLTFLFSLFWVGWPLFAVIIGGSGLLIFLINRFRDDGGMEQAGRFICVYALTVFLLMIFHMGPVIFFKWCLGVIKGLVSFSRARFGGLAGYVHYCAGDSVCRDGEGNQTCRKRFGFCDCGYGIYSLCP